MLRLQNVNTLLLDVALSQRIGIHDVEILTKNVVNTYNFWSYLNGHFSIKVNQNTINRISDRMSATEIMLVHYLSGLPSHCFRHYQYNLNHNSIRKSLCSFYSQMNANELYCLPTQQTLAVRQPCLRLCCLSYLH